MGCTLKQAEKRLFGGAGRGFIGSQAAQGGRIHGQKVGESIRLTGAKAGLGAGRKEIAG